MSVPKLRIMVVGVVATLGLVVPPAHAQLPGRPGVAVCVVSGFVAVNPGVPIPPAAKGPGTYATNVALVCAGSLSGVCFVGSAGNTDGDSPTSGFSGDFNSTAPCIPTNQTCSGNIGGPRLVNWHAAPPLPTVTPTPFPNPNWSFSAVPLLLASLGDVDCTGINIPPLPPSANLNDGRGVFAAIAAPDPLTLNGACGNPSGAPVNFCGIVIAGVAVISWPVSATAT